MFENHIYYAWYNTLGVRPSEAQGYDDPQTTYRDQYLSAEWETQQREHSLDTW